MAADDDVTASRRESLDRAAVEASDAAIAFCRELVRIPSPSGDEEHAARRTLEEMQSLGFDEAEIDSAGNVIGIFRATADEPRSGAVLLDAHLDHVGIGDVSRFPHPPFDGVIEDGRLWGRGSTDTKSAVATQVHGAALLARVARESGTPLRRDVVVAAVVQEEIGGLGTACLLDSGLDFRFAIIGEPSLGQLAAGHRGRVELEVGFEGRAAHASRPEWGVNPHGSLSRFVQALDAVERDEDARFGRSTVSPTLVRAEPLSPNVIPQRVQLTLDWRNVPDEAAPKIADRVRAIAETAAEDGVTATVEVPQRELRSWTGCTRRVDRISRPFATDPEHPAFQRAHAALGQALDREVPIVNWDFASDGGWLAAAGVTCLGYGPGEMRVMHAPDESVSIDLVAETVLGNAVLASSLTEEPDTESPS